MSRVFTRVVRLVLLPGILDTQAGLKGFTARAAEVIFPRLTIAGFGFDVELLYIAKQHGLTVAQAAVHYRYDDEPSTVRFAADAVEMLEDLVRSAGTPGGGATADARRLVVNADDFG